MSKRVLIATPCYGDVITSGYMLSLLQSICNNKDPNISFSIYTLGNESLITRARNKCVAYFLAGNYTHLFFIDADIQFPPQSINRIVNFDKEVVCGVYPRKSIIWDNLDNKEDLNALSKDEIKNKLLSLNYIKLNKDLTNINGFIKIDYAATGFLCIKREVFDKMRLAYPEQKYNHAEIEESLKQHTWLFFDCMVDEHKIYLSEDFAFSKKWKKLGGEIWLDTQTNLTHTGTYRFCGNTPLFFEKLLNNKN